MKNYVKAVLYAYPLLATVEEDYEAHIKNKALLSYDNGKSAEEAAIYLAGEILEMRRLEWLKERVERVLARLTDVEKTLVAVRYFGKGKRVKSLSKREKNDALCRPSFTERTYFRRQQRLGEKLCGLFVACEIDEVSFQKDYLSIPLFKKIYEGVGQGRDKKIAARERQYMGF